MPKKRNNVHLIGISLILFTAVVSHWRWFFTFSIYSYGDWIFHNASSMVEWLSPPLLWLTQNGFGYPNVGLSGWPYLFIYGIFGYFGLNSEVADKFVFMIPSVVLAILGSFYLARSVLKSTVGAVVASFVFAYNSYFIIGRTGHLTLMTAFSLTPFALLLYIKSLELKRIFMSVSAGLLFSFIAIFEFRAFYIFAWVCFFYFIWHLIFRTEKKFTSVFRTSLYAIIPIIIVFLHNLYWIMGLSNLGFLSDNTYYTRTLFGNRFMNVLESMTLFHPFWTGSELYIFKVQPIPFYFFLIPLAALAGLWIGRKNHLVLFFGVISVLGVFLAKQAGMPFEGAYQWLYSKFPGFGAFRESSKFYYLVALGYSILLGSFAGTITEGWKSENIRGIKRILLPIIISLIFVWNTRPLITGEIGTLFEPRIIPQDYHVLNKFLLSQHEYFRTLWMPVSSKWGVYTIDHPKVSFASTSRTSWKNFSSMVTAGDIHNSREEKFLSLFRQQYSDSLLDISSIKYLIIPLEDNTNDNNFYISYGDKSKFEEIVESLGYLSKLDIGTKEVLVYENLNFKPQFYITPKLLVQQEDILAEKVSSKRISLTEYRFELNEVKDTLFLNFSETFHPKWKIMLGQMDWLSSDKTLAVLPDKFHIVNWGGFNTFKIDPEFIKMNFSNDFFQINPDGSLNMRMTVYFSPQRSVFLGLIVSGLTFLACILYLILSITLKISKASKT